MSAPENSPLHEAGDMNRDEPPIQYKPRLGYDDGPYRPGPCWHRNYIDCCCGGLLGSPLPSGVRHMDCIFTNMLYKVGAYYGGNFNREAAEAMPTERRMGADIMNTSGMNAWGMTAMDVKVPSVYKPGLEIPVRIFKQTGTQLNTRKIVYYIHGGGW